MMQCILDSPQFGKLDVSNDVISLRFTTRENAGMWLARLTLETESLWRITQNWQQMTVSIYNKGILLWQGLAESVDYNRKGITVEAFGLVRSLKSQHLYKLYSDSSGTYWYNSNPTSQYTTTTISDVLSITTQDTTIPLGQTTEIKYPDPNAGLILGGDITAIDLLPDLSVTLGTWTVDLIDYDNNEVVPIFTAKTNGNTLTITTDYTVNYTNGTVRILSGGSTVDNELLYLSYLTESQLSDEEFQANLDFAYTLQNSNVQSIDLVYGLTPYDFYVENTDWTLDRENNVLVFLSTGSIPLNTPYNTDVDFVVWIDDLNVLLSAYDTWFDFPFGKPINTIETFEQSFYIEGVDWEVDYINGRWRVPSGSSISPLGIILDIDLTIIEADQIISGRVDAYDTDIDLRFDASFYEKFDISRLYWTINDFRLQASKDYTITTDYTVDADFNITPLSTGTIVDGSLTYVNYTYRTQIEGEPFYANLDIDVFTENTNIVSGSMVVNFVSTPTTFDITDSETAFPYTFTTPTQNIGLRLICVNGGDHTATVEFSSVKVISEDPFFSSDVIDDILTQVGITPIRIDNNGYTPAQANYQGDNYLSVIENLAFLGDGTESWLFMVWEDGAYFTAWDTEPTWMLLPEDVEDWSIEETADTVHNAIRPKLLSGTYLAWVEDADSIANYGRRELPEFETNTDNAIEGNTRATIALAEQKDPAFVIRVRGTKWVRRPDGSLWEIWRVRAGTILRLQGVIPYITKDIKISEVEYDNGNLRLIPKGGDDRLEILLAT